MLKIPRTPAICAAIFAIPWTASASWLTIDNPPPSSEITMNVGDTNSLTLPGSGSATVELQAQSGSAVFLLRSNPFYPAATFSQFPANGLDPTGLDIYVVESTGTGTGSVDVRFDFSGLGAGVLPAGSIFLVLDLDSFESLDDLTGFGSGSTLLTTPWLQAVSFFDSDGPGNGTASNTPAFLFASNAYQFSPTGSGDIGVHYFRTLTDLESLTMTGVADHGPRGFAVAFGTADVPEPSTLTMAGLALVGLGAIRRRRRPV